MVAFPSIQTPSFPINETTNIPYLKSEMDDGFVISRRKGTRKVLEFEIRWPGLPIADYSTLKSFFDANLGGVFDWTHPITAAVHEVRFSEGSLAASQSVPGYLDVNLKIEET